MNELLKTYIREFLSESHSHYLTKEMSNEVFAILKKQGIIASKFISNGAYSKVWLAHDAQGNPIAVKISPNENEWRPYAKISDLASKMPKRLVKHIPVIYSAKLIETPSHGKISVVIMELLKKAPEKLIDDVMGSETYIENIERVINDPILVNKICQHQNRKNYLALNSNVAAKVWNAFAGGIIRGIGPNNFEISNVSNIVNILENFTYDDKKHLMKAAKILNAGFQSVVEVLQNENFDNADSIQHATEIVTQFVIMSRNPGIPNKSWNNDADMNDFIGVSTNKTAVSFFAALKILKKLGLQWGDLHSANVMIRPSTGDLVVSDVGMFT